MFNRQPKNNTHGEKVFFHPQETPTQKSLVFRDYVIDTTSSIVFFTPIMALMEYFIAGMTGSAVLTSRIIAIVIGVLLARVYGIFREWWAAYTKTNRESSKERKFIVDTSARVLFQLPTYPVFLFIAGASVHQVLIALPTGIAIGIASGRPYGYFLDVWRKLWGGKPTL